MLFISLVSSHLLQLLALWHRDADRELIVYRFFYFIFSFFRRLVSEVMNGLNRTWTHIHTHTPSIIWFKLGYWAYRQWRNFSLNCEGDHWTKQNFWLGLLVKWGSVLPLQKSGGPDPRPLKLRRCHCLSGHFWKSKCNVGWTTSYAIRSWSAAVISAQPATRNKEECCWNYQGCVNHKKCEHPLIATMTAVRRAAFTHHRQHHACGVTQFRDRPRKPTPLYRRPVRTHPLPGAPVISHCVIHDLVLFAIFWLASVVFPFHLHRLSLAVP